MKTDDRRFRALRDEVVEYTYPGGGKVILTIKKGDIFYWWQHAPIWRTDLFEEIT